MSQSPTAFAELAEKDQYLRGWDALGAFLAQGRTFSGRERNCCFLNTADGRFAPAAACTGLDHADDGRAVALVDWDHDGDLDLWLASRTGPRLRLLRNDINAGNHFLAFRLLGKDCNRDAVGARVEVHARVPEPVRYLRTLQAGNAFLSQSSKWIHFGLPADAKLEQVLVRWPGQRECEVFGGVQLDGHYILTQHAGEATGVTLPAPSPHAAGPPTVPRATRSSRVVSTNRRSLPPLRLTTFDGQARQTRSFDMSTGRPVVLNLWASWCPPCTEELRELANSAEEIRGAGVDLLAISVDELSADSGGDVKAADEFLVRISWPFGAAHATQQAIDALTQSHNAIVYEQRDLPLPSSFLLDPQGRVAAVYKGPLGTRGLLSDVALLQAGAGRLEATAFPFKGRQAINLFPFDAVSTALAYREGGYLEEAKVELREYLNRNAHLLGRGAALNEGARERLFRALRLLATVEDESGRHPESVDALKQALQLMPGSTPTQAALGVATWRAGDKEMGEALLRQASLAASEQADALRAVGRAWKSIGRWKECLDNLEKSARLAPRDGATRLGLARAYHEAGQFGDAIRAYQLLLRQNPAPPEAASGLVWLWSTCADPRYRNGDAALRLAIQLCKSTGHTVAEYESALAAAHAQLGGYVDAVRAAENALKLARAAGEELLLGRIERQLEAYRAGRQYVDGPPRE